MAEITKKILFQSREPDQSPGFSGKYFREPIEISLDLPDAESLVRIYEKSESDPKLAYMTCVDAEQRAKIDNYLKPLPSRKHELWSYVLGTVGMFTGSGVRWGIFSCDEFMAARLEGLVEAGIISDEQVDKIHSHLDSLDVKSENRDNLRIVYCENLNSNIDSDMMYHTGLNVIDAIEDENYDLHGEECGSETLPFISVIRVISSAKLKKLNRNLSLYARARAVLKATMLVTDDFDALREYTDNTNRFSVLSRLQATIINEEPV